MKQDNRLAFAVVLIAVTAVVGAGLWIAGLSSSEVTQQGARVFRPGVRRMYRVLAHKYRHRLLTG